jgi:hypothetical protein
VQQNLFIDSYASSDDAGLANLPEKKPAAGCRNQRLGTSEDSAENVFHNLISVYQAVRGGFLFTKPAVHGALRFSSFVNISISLPCYHRRYLLMQNITQPSTSVTQHSSNHYAALITLASGTSGSLRRVDMTTSIPRIREMRGKRENVDHHEFP